MRPSVLVDNTRWQRFSSEQGDQPPVVPVVHVQAVLVSYDVRAWVACLRGPGVEVMQHPGDGYVGLGGHQFACRNVPDGDVEPSGGVKPG